MTEQEWLACEDPQPMLWFMQDRMSDRHSWAFIAACLRRTIVAMGERNEERRRSLEEAIEPLDRFLLGTANEVDLESLYPPDRTNPAFGDTMACSLNAAEEVTEEILCMKRFANRTKERRAAAKNAARIATRNAERTAQAVLLRCILGNPFHPITIHAQWLTSNVVDLAQTVYEEQAFDRMPILAVALTDAGCDNADILDHCKGPGPHTRGCWVVDLLIGKS